MGSELPKEPPKELSFWVLFWIAFAVIALWAGTGFLLYDATSETPIWGERGTFGDMFGSINALFSGLAFSGLIFTVLLQRQELQMQRHELRLQREEIVESRKELAGQRMQLEAQSDTFSRQSFESTFFSLLSVMQNLAGHDQKSVHDAIYNAWDAACWHRDSTGGSENLIDCIECMEAGVEEKATFIFPAYLDCLGCILKHIASAEIGDKSFYASLLRSQTTEVQRIAVFYSVANSPFHTETKALIERFGFFKGINPKNLFSIEHRFAYNEMAYV